jgi:hypothetical protein
MVSSSSGAMMEESGGSGEDVLEIWRFRQPQIGRSVKYCHSTRQTISDVGDFL